MSAIHEKLIAIQSKLKVPKNQVNAFGKYKYRSCEDILEAVKPLVHEEKCYLIESDEVVEVSGRAYVKAVATLSDGDSSISVSAFAKEATEQKGMSDAQITGAASSYARKYALNGLFCIDDTKDADATNDHKETKKKPDITLVTKSMEEAADITKLNALMTKSKTYDWNEQESEVIDSVYTKVKIKLSNPTNE